MAGTDDQSPHSGEDFLDANRKNRAKARDAAEREAARKTARTLTR